MSGDHLRDKTVQYFIVALLAAVILFLVYGLVKGDGDSGSSGSASTPATPAQPQLPATLKPQVGCQQPASATKRVKGQKTIPPNPGVSAKASGKRAAVISITVPVSTQECRVTQIQVQLDSSQDKIPPKVRTIDATTGGTTREVKITLSRRSGPPQAALGASITADGRPSTGALVSVR